MSALTYYQQLFGAGEFCLLVEGVPDYWSTCFLAWDFGSLPADMPTPGGALRSGLLNRESLRASQRVDPASGELSQGDMIFELLDGEDSDGAIYSVSALMSRRAAAVQAHLAADLAAGAASMTLDSTAGFVAPGVAHIELEAVAFTGIAAGPPRLTGLTRGLYGSVDRAHEYEAPNAAITTADYGQIPLVTDRLVSWYGRRCWLYFAEYLEDGTLDSAEVVWRGVLTSELRATSKMTWSLPAEGIWSAQSVELLGSQPQSVVKGIYLSENTVVRFWMNEAWGGDNVGDSSFTLTAGRYTVDGFCAHFTEQLNAELDSIALSDCRWSLYVQDGLLFAAKPISDGVTPLTCTVYVLEADPLGVPQGDIVIVAAVLGLTPTPQGGGGTSLEFPEGGIGGHYLGLRAPESVFVSIQGAGDFEVPVEDAAVFADFLDEDVVNDWLVQSVVTIDGQPYMLIAVTAASHRITCRLFADRVDAASTIVVQYVGDAALQVKQGVWFKGQMPLVWRDAFLDNANVPERMKLGADSRDFDWDDLDAQFPGGAMDRRDRLITGPVAFKNLIVEDFRFSGMAPVIGLDGRITARPINSSNLVRDDGSALLEVDEDIDSATDRPETVRSAKRVVNRLEVHVVREHGRPGGLEVGDSAIDLTILVNEKTSQAAYRSVRGSSFEFSGTSSVDPVEIAGHIYGVAASLFSLLAQDADTMRLGPLNGLAYGTLLLDTILVSHWMPPDPTNAGERGLASLPAVVLGMEMDYARGELHLDVQLVTDGGQRSGFAPAADINTYANHGGGTEPRRYEISLTTGQYCPAAVEEGTFFHVGDKVVIRQWDVDAITVADESFTLTAVDPDALFLDAAPSAGMQAEIAAGRANVTFDLFDTASQNALAKLYLHVADDADNLLGTSGVLGFRVS